MAVSLSQSETKALNPSPNTAPAVLPGTKHNYHTGCLHCGSRTRCRPLGLWFNTYLQLRERLEDNMPVIRRIKEKRKVILPSLYRFKNSLSVFGGFQADLLPDQVGVLPLHLGTGFGLRFNAKQVVLVSQLHFMFNGSWEEKNRY